MATTKKKIEDVTLPQDLIELLQSRGLGGKRMYIPVRQAGTQVHDKLVKMLDEVEHIYESTGMRLYGRQKDLRFWKIKFPATGISVAHSISMRSAQRLKPVAMGLWKRFFRNTELPIIARLENCASAYQLDYMELNIFYRRERAKSRTSVADQAPWFGTDFAPEVMAELKECIADSLAKRPWNNKDSGSELLEMKEELEKLPDASGIHPESIRNKSCKALKTCKKRKWICVMFVNGVVERFYQGER